MKICVYGASSNKLDDVYITQGEALGRAMAKRGHDLVFGAGGNGLMGAVARGVYEGGGEIVGVVPRFFNVDGMLFEHHNELIRTDTMRERKQIMEDRCEAFIMTPGGIGTFEEFFEVLTLKQLGRHGKAIAVLNTEGYYNTLLDMISLATAKYFMKASCRSLFQIFDDVEPLLDYLETYKMEPASIGSFKNIFEGDLVANGQ